MRTLSLFLFVILKALPGWSQLIEGTDTLYGNEWIRYDQSYYKFYTSRDGLCKIKYEDLIRAGVPMSGIKSSQLQIWKLGQELPLYIPNPGSWNPGDALYFWGTKNRSELDVYLFKNPSTEMLNPEYSLVTDSSTYFLTWLNDGGLTQRVNILPSNTQIQASSFIMVDQLYEYHVNPLDKRYDFFNEIAFSSFDECEGFGTRMAKEYNQAFKAVDPYIGTQDGKLVIRLAGNFLAHQIKITINSEQVILENFNGYQLKEYEIPIKNELLNSEIKLHVEGMAGPSDAYTISNIHFIYPKKRDGIISANENFLPPSQNSLIQLNKLNQQSLLIGPQARQWYAASLLNSQYFLEVPSNIDFKKPYATSLADASTISDLKPVKFDNTYMDQNDNYLIITHPALKASAEQYAAYRRSNLGGPFKVRILYIDQIYDQFGYGMSRHVLGLKNFGMYIHKNWVTPQFVFMIGRAMNYRDLRVDNNVTQYGHLHLLPTYGYPGSDHLIFAVPGSNLPVFNSTRLAASTPDQVITYLNKVKEYEDKLINPKSNDDLYWRKRVLHLAGGGPEDGFDQKLDALKSIIESNDLRAKVYAIKKSSSDPVQGGVSEIVKNIVNEGVFMSMYLGHGAVTSTEIGLDDPEIFNNIGKYPICFTLGCNSGNMHTTSYSLSESFIFSKKGGIAYFSSSGIGTDDGYYRYGDFLYKSLGRDYYQKSISEAHFATLRNFENARSIFSVALNQQHTIQGDPAIKFNYNGSPDLTLDFKSFQTIPENVQAEQEKLQFKFTLWNLGRHTNENIEYEVKHQLPDGSVLTYLFSERLTESFKELTVSLPMPPNVEGNNVIYIKIDPGNKIVEGPVPFAENNNELKSSSNGIVVGIFNNEARPIYPKNFGIVGESNIELKAYTTNAFSKVANYYYELDTTALFNSSLVRKSTVRQRGGLIAWKPDLNWQVNKVYYWRIASDTTGTGKSFFWTTSSFIYLPGQGPGWNQSHQYQFASNLPNQSLFTEPQTGTWKIANESVSIVATSINQEAEPGGFSNVKINGARFTRDNRAYQSELILTIWDPELGLVRNPVGGRDGAKNVFSVPAPGYYFPMDKNTVEERQNLIRFMEQGVKPGQYVIVITHIEPGKSYFPDFWEGDSTQLGKTLFDVFEANGARQIRDLVKPDTYSYPYVFVYKKGTGLIDERVSRNGLSVIANFELPLKMLSGSHESVLIGPAISWQQFEWKLMDNRAKSNNTVVIYGHIDQLQFDTIYSGSESAFDLSQVDAQRYPFLRLEWIAKDSAKSGSIQMNHWRVYYKTFADLSIASNDDFEFYKDTIDQGEDVRLRYILQNLGDVTIDSSQIIYTVTDEQNRTIKDTTFVSALTPGGKKVMNKLINTDTRVKNQSILINVSPLNIDKEYSILNNAGKLNFYVVTDIIPPVVSVLFDGKQIINNEIVARKPLINVELKDNKNLTIKDTTQMEISIKRPGSDKFILVSPKDYTMTFSKNEASVQYAPTFTLNGEYTLKVQGIDKSGNKAGIQPYEVNFRIFTENSVSSILPYPNPMTSQCRFAYTLTGERPMVFKIQIMTVSGRVVRELTEIDLGPLEEGTHLTERSWDGTDEYGNNLATGTYLYRVVMKDISGKSYSSFEDLEESASTDARRFFTKGLGKLVILR